MTRLDLRGESGFTLIELMVATICGIIVSAATLAIVITSVHLTSNYTDRVDATQEGRTALVTIAQALDSSCVATGLAPILPQSDANDVWFYSSQGLVGSLGDSPTIDPNKIEVSLTGGSLVMNTYAYASGTAGSWTFASTPTTFTLVPNAAAVGSTAVFQYYGYNSSGVLSSTPYTLTGSPATLGSTNASTTASVAINFASLPTDNWNAQGRAADFSDSVVLRLTPAAVAAGDTACS